MNHDNLHEARLVRIFDFRPRLVVSLLKVVISIRLIVYNALNYYILELKTAAAWSLILN